LSGGNELGWDDSLGIGIEGSYSFLGNLFIKASATYFWGANDLYTNSSKIGFYPDISRISQIENIGKGWIFGAAVGYHFYMFMND
jgi:long-subunit fatty acid transport protein